MHSTLLSQTVNWVWLVAALGAIGLVGFQFGAAIADDDYEFGLLTVSLLGLQAAVGLLFFTLNALGYPSAAQWSWRILATASVIVAFAALLRSSFSLDSKTAAFIPSLACSIFLAASSFFVRSGVLPASLPGVVLWTPQNTVNLAITTALLLLALLTTLFTYLFLSVVRREGLSLEFIDGGIGGGSRVARVPPSASYLLCTVLSGAGFLMLLVHEEARIYKGEPVHTETAPAAVVAPTAASQPAKPASLSLSTPAATSNPAQSAKPTE
jgi:hypothetical protein